MNSPAKPCLITCGIFQSELDRIIENEALNVDVRYLNPGLHNDPKTLANVLKKAIETHQNPESNRIILIYGDICLGFNGEMKALNDQYGTVKVDALNCIDCLLGGQGKLLETDPKHEYFFLNPAWIKLEFGDRDMKKDPADAREEFSVLSGLFLLDTMGDLDDYTETLEEIKKFTNLPVVERRDIGLKGIREIILEALEKLD